MQSKNSSGLKKYLTLFFLAIVSGTAFAQADYQVKQLSDYYRSNKMVTSDWKRDLTIEDIEGTPFLVKDYTNGTIYTIQKQKFVDVPLRYNMYNDRIEFQTADGNAAEIAVPDDVEKIEFGTYEFWYVKLSGGKKGFLQVLEKGEACLYAQHKALFRDKKAPAAYQDAEPARFEQLPTVYFIGIMGEEAKPAGSKKELVQIFPDHQAEIETFISKNKIKSNKPESLTELVKYYNSL